MMDLDTKNLDFRLNSHPPTAALQGTLKWGTWLVIHPSPQSWPSFGNEICLYNDVYTLED